MHYSSVLKSVTCWVLAFGLAGAPGVTLANGIGGETGESSLSTPLAQSVPSVAPQQVKALEVALNRIPLEAKLFNGKFQGYQLRITNTSTQPVNLLETAVGNSVNGEEAYTQVHKKVIGLTSFLGVSGLVLTTWRRTSRNNRAKKESQQYTNAPLTGTLQPGQTVESRGLIPMEQSMASLTLRYQNPETGEEITQNHDF